MTSHLMLISLLAGLCSYAVLAQRPAWERMPGFDGGFLVSVAVHPKTGTILTAEDDAVFRSTDGGGSWTYAMMYLLFPATLVIDSAGTVYAGSDAGVHRSNDDGVTWTRLAGIAQPIGALCINRNTGTMFAGTAAGVVFRSTDRCVTWFPSLSTGGPQDNIQDLYCNGTGVVYACTRQSRLWKSDDDGATWIHLDDSSIVQLSVRAIAGDADGTNLFIGTDSAVFRSIDRGRSWSPTGFPGDANASALYRHDNGHLYAGSDRGAFISTDEGRTWEDLQLPRTDLTVYRFAYDVGRNMLLASTTRGLFGMTMSTRSWKVLGVPAMPISCIKPTRGGTLYAAAAYYDMFASSDAGLSWDTTGIRWVMSMDEDASRGIVYAGGYWGIHRSTTGGKSWETVNTSLQGSICMLVLPDGNVLAGAATIMGIGLGVYLSSDQGMSWEKRNTGISDSAIYAIVRNPRSGMLLLSTFTGELYRSADGGNTWINAATAWPHGINVCLGVDSAGGFLAGTSTGSAFRSMDDACSWMPINKGLPGSGYVNGFAVNSAGHMFTATAPHGIFRSTDDGQSWEDAGDGMLDRIVYTIAADNAGYVYAGTFHGGLFRTRFPTTRAEAPPPPAGITLEQNYPNPFPRATSVRYTLDRDSRVRLVVADALGRECAVLQEGPVAAGTHTCRWDAAAATSSRPFPGVYFCRLAVSPDDGMPQERIIRMTVMR